MLIHAIRSEWTKLRSTKAFWWTSGLFLFFSIGFAFLVSRNVETSVSFSGALLGVQGFGLLVLMIQAIMVITSEYRHGSQVVTFLAVPNRLVVAAAKWLCYVAVALVLLVVTFGVIAGLVKGVAGVEVADFGKLLAIYVFSTVALITLSQGVAYLTRQAAGAIALVLLWQLALEVALSFLPKIGPYIYRYAPFHNLTIFQTQQSSPDLPWEWEGSGIYFAAWAVAIFVVGIVLLKKRDA